MFPIFFSSHGERAFASVPPEIKKRIVETLGELAQDKTWYRHAKKLRGTENRYRLRLGRWRVLFILEDKGFEVVDIFLKKGRGDYSRRQ